MKISTYCGRPFPEDNLRLIRQIIDAEDRPNRAEISRRVCRGLQWLRPDGRLKDMSCRVALLRMHREGVIRLPPPVKGNANGHRGKRITHRSDPGLPVTDGAGKLPALRLELVCGQQSSSLWNEYIHRYHYLGYQPLPGAQLRYLIMSADQVLGALGFGAAAWKTAPRDQWIGWTPEQRKSNLHLVVNNARFLILPWVTSRNLASKVLARAARRLAADWELRYSYRPVLLETFVQKDRFAGTCYKAANWTYLGDTKGRGKLDVRHENAVPIKAVFVYPLVPNCKNQLAQ
ncbi:MAG: DUF4338 domain-containing protein [Lentisphaeria bacterium]|nr:DUF4338 domain-containing protein [Lentisphaeria bacterium]